MPTKYIDIKGARQNNLKNINVRIPHNKLSVFTGLSGSGKSSLVVDTVYAEGYRRYVESLSSYTRQFLEKLPKPDVDIINGLRPSIAIEQKTLTKNSRSIVATTTEIYDFYRLLFAKVGKTYCLICNNEVKRNSTETVIEWLKKQNLGDKYILAIPANIEQEFGASNTLRYLLKKGYFRFLIDGEYYDFSDNEDFNFEQINEILIVFQRFILNEDSFTELQESIDNAFSVGEGRIVIINKSQDKTKKFSKFLECCGVTYNDPDPKMFSFNSPFGACPVCEGFGKTIGIDLNLVVPDPEKSIREDAIVPISTLNFAWIKRDLIESAKYFGIPTNVPFRELTNEQIDLIFKGFGYYIGLNAFFEELEKKSYKVGYRILLNKYRGYTTCSACKGTRLRREALQVKINNKSIHDLIIMSIKDNLKFFNSLELSEFEKEVAKQILNEIIKRLTFLEEIGLGYLTLDRQSGTLSGGEAQRINLATSLGSALTSSIYILDEPSIGLHPADNIRLINLLHKLKNFGNTVLVIEHDPDMIENADVIYEIGPKSGIHGGELVASGTIDEINNNDNSLTGKYLSGKLKIPLPEKRRAYDTPKIEIVDAYENNLKHISVKIPLNKLVVVTGVSGSGKSTLIHDVVYGNIAKFFRNPVKVVGKCKNITGLKNIDGIEIVDQSPIGKSSRSNPISYIGGYDIIRDIFASTPLARANGFKPGFFSMNVDGGRCDECKGEGFIKIEMQFLSDVYMQCESCHGKRFKPEIQQIYYRNKNIVDVLNMTVDEAFEFFYDVPKLLNYLIILKEVGLGYIKLGQPSNTLSGGEAQRLKLAYSLSKNTSSDNILYIFDEPTTGLHFEDIKYLLKSFDTLIKRNNSLIVIEHNLDLIKCADYIIDLGPGAGDDGGNIVATGTPEEIVKNPNSITGKYLKKYLE